MKYLTLLLTLPALAWTGACMAADEEDSAVVSTGAAQQTQDDSTVNWVDDGHAYATDQAQALTEWMDSFFGDPVYDLEKPESLVRVELANTWDEEEDPKTRVRLRGKIRLPRLSERLNLVFSGDDGDPVPVERRGDNDGAGLQYKVGERNRSRFDLTMGLNTDGPKPGMRYRNQGAISNRWGYRFTQRLQWQTDDGLYTTGQFNLDHAMSRTKLVRWGSRVRYGEETDGVEWRTGLSLNQKFNSPVNHEPYVLSLFTGVSGVTEPSFVKNYRFGGLFRRQLFRRYFFVEVEPSYNFRKRDNFESRSKAWNVVLRLEVLFDAKRRRLRAKATPETDAPPNESADAQEVAAHGAMQPQFPPP